MPDFLDRRKFMKETAIKASGLAFLPFLDEKVKVSKVFSSKGKPALAYLEPRLKFGVISINHSHIYSMSQAVINGGGELKSFYCIENDLAAVFSKRFPNAKRVVSSAEILGDASISLILSSAIPNERAGIAIQAMNNGKHVLVDKPGITDMAQLKKVKEVQKKTGKIFSICYSERFENRATERASTLVKEGAIGKVIQTLGTGPHKITPASRPSWFWDKKYFGGIITDIGSHQVDQFLHFTGSDTATVVASQVGNFGNQEHVQFEDFGDLMLKGNNGTGYIRVDWFTPNSLKAFGDGRLTILGTDGYIEIRKNIDITRKDNGSHLYLSTQKETVYIDCSEQILPFGPRFVDDILNGTETAMTQAHCFKTMELAILAQKNASKI